MELTIRNQRSRPGARAEQPSDLGKNDRPSPDGDALRSGEALCLSCGLCCSGAIFVDVGVESEAEIARVEAAGIVMRDGGFFPLPCSAHKDGRCGIYADRPRACRHFRCALLNKLTAREISPLHADAIVKRAQAYRQSVLIAASEYEPAAETMPLRDLERAFYERLAGATSQSETQAYSRVLLHIGVLLRLISNHFWKDDRWTSG